MTTGTTKFNPLPVMTVGKYTLIKIDDTYTIAKEGAPSARVTESAIERALKEAYESDF